ncbi:UDP-N-acetylglucosamine 2-epimerase [Hydrogenovibrio crunogenus]|uniref:UDP-N-acetylglucosamine 2-epimerase n=1 Tax=Hydrogenovibrio crunogenus TaxID=39765 RepID=UPI00167A2726|nr:UDP-N-acetylglucosamine 2-epimerase [Hydrogenovibrio crunogenus]
MIKKVAIVTATRAEYGLLSNLIKAVDAHPKFDCQLLVTGAHLVFEQGLTVKHIRADGVEIAAEIPILPETTTNGNENVTLSDAVAKATSGFARAFARLTPDCVVVLGDRYELLGICSAALLAHIPIVHIHGGEVTEGAVDEAIRHAVTKMAHLHFVAAEPYRQRVIQMGEQPQCVFNVGAPGLDVIKTTEFLSKKELSDSLEMPLTSPLFLVTYHPVSWGETSGITALHNLFKAIEQFPDATVVWTAANTDATGAELNQHVNQWISTTQMNATFVSSLGSQRYLSLMKVCDVVLGNSSSGIIEAPAMGVATVNIGKRQTGRLRAPSVIDCDEQQQDIRLALEQSLAPEFKILAAKKVSCYGQGHSAKEMVGQLEKALLSERACLGVKSFYNLPLNINESIDEKGETV